MLMNTAIALRELGTSLGDRLSPDRLRYALDYIDFNEEPLALDTLCGFLCDDDIVITSDEYARIKTLDNALGSTLSRNALSHLKALSSS